LCIYEYLASLGNEYSIIRDTILAMNDTIFDLENSIPIGVDPTGNTLYDSVCVITNPIFERVNIRCEFSNVTRFLPRNEVVEKCVEDLGTLYDQLGKDFFETESVTAYMCIQEAMF